MIEQGFGWAKTVGRIRQVMVRGLQRVDQMFVLTMTAYNLTRMRTLGQIRLQTQLGVKKTVGELQTDNKISKNNLISTYKTIPQK